MFRTLSCRYFRRAFGWCVPIGGLAGLIGLGGGEFRLPVLMHAIGFGAKAAVPLNLMVSMVTLTFALVTRSRFVSTADVMPYLDEMMGLISGGMISAFWGARLVQSMSSERLVQTIGLLLAALGGLLLLEVAFPFQSIGLLPANPVILFAVGSVFGLGIGLVSSLLGVAGGELLIPTLMFVFGADIRTAGSASILISLCLITVGLWRHWRLGTLPWGGSVQRLTMAMSLGSILGAGLGGLAVAVAPVAALKLLLGCVLVAAAGKTILTRR